MIPMKHAMIQYRYFDDSVCNRCIDTERELRSAIEAFTSRCRNVRVELLKQKLSHDKIEKSPTILVDGVDIETILTRSSTPKTSACGECSCIAKKEVSCRSYSSGDTLSQSALLLGLSTYVCNSKRKYFNPCTC